MNNSLVVSAMEVHGELLLWFHGELNNHFCPQNPVGAPVKVIVECEGIGEKQWINLNR